MRNEIAEAKALIAKDALPEIAEALLNQGRWFLDPMVEGVVGVDDEYEEVLAVVYVNEGDWELSERFEMSLYVD